MGNTENDFVYQVYVGNVGLVYKGNSEDNALNVYNEFTKLSKDGVIPVALEPVSLLMNDRTIIHYPGK